MVFLGLLMAFLWFPKVFLSFPMTYRYQWFSIGLPMELHAFFMDIHGCPVHGYFLDIHVHSWICRHSKRAQDTPQKNGWCFVFSWFFNTMLLYFYGFNYSKVDWLVDDSWWIPILFGQFLELPTFSQNLDLFFFDVERLQKI